MKKLEDEHVHKTRNDEHSGRFENPKDRSNLVLLVCVDMCRDVHRHARWTLVTDTLTGVWHAHV